MKPRHAIEHETRLLLQLVAAIKGLNVAGELEAGRTISLTCPCGKLILPPLSVLSSVKDRQRGLLKSKVERHLRNVHGISARTITRVLKESFIAN